MRIFCTTAALALSLPVYSLCPELADRLASLLGRLFGFCARKTGVRSQAPALAAFLLTLCVPGFLISLFPAPVTVFFMIPLFPAMALLPQCGKVQTELDSGAYRENIPAYESQVRSTCAALAPSFVCDCAVPVILCCLGTPLYLGAALGWCWLGLRSISEICPSALKVIILVQRPADALFRFLLTLFAGFVGKSSFHTSGKNARSRLLSVLGIAENSRGHAPVSGDIAQGIFLCCVCCVFICLLFSFPLLPLCR